MHNLQETVSNFFCFIYTGCIQWIDHKSLRQKNYNESNTNNRKLKLPIYILKTKVYNSSEFTEQGLSTSQFVLFIMHLIVFTLQLLIFQKYTRHTV